MSWGTALKATAAAATAAMVLAACTGGGGGSAGNKAGGDAAPVTLRIGTDDDGPETPGGAQIQEFARQVQQRSKGHVRIEPVWQAAGEHADDWDQAVGRMVVRGELNMGMIPARAWDTEGVTSLRALHAPFLVTTDQLVGGIVKGELSAEMLAGLEKIGVTGLALLPEGLRHLFAFKNPPLSPADYRGLVVRAPLSRTTYAAFEALGAKPDDFGGPGDRFADGVRKGQIGGAESSFALAAPSLPAPTTAVGNITFFPKVNSLVINAKVLAGLSEDQRAVLKNAAQATVDWAIATTRSDAEAAKEYCANGGRIVLAGSADVAKFQAAVQPVYRQLEQDAATKALIARIRSLGGQTGPGRTAVKPCGPGATAPATAGSDTVGAFPEGVYRTDMPEEFLVQAGVDRQDAHNHAGIVTLTFKDGRFITDCPRSSYSVKNGRVVIQMGPQGEGCGTAAGKVLFSARWTLQGDQLRFLDVRSGHGSDLLIQTLFGGKPFTKIG
jgi:TRAP-type C4-dicarboxylate transport system substrate-binding protein